MKSTGQPPGCWWTPHSSRTWCVSILLHLLIRLNCLRMKLAACFMRRHHIMPVVEAKRVACLELTHVAAPAHLLLQIHDYSAVPDLGTFVAARVTAIAANSVTLDTGAAVEYDYLILAPGSSYPEPAIKAFSGSLADRQAAIKVHMSGAAHGQRPVIPLCKQQASEHVCHPASWGPSLIASAIFH